jgi:hypothetical protein
VSRSIIYHILYSYSYMWCKFGLKLLFKFIHIVDAKFFK